HGVSDQPDWLLFAGLRAGGHNPNCRPAFVLVHRRRVEGSANCQFAVTPSSTRSGVECTTFSSGFYSTYYVLFSGQLMNQFDFKQYYRRSLPHVQQPAGTLFVTFRLDGSIPRSVLDEWLREKKILEYKRLRRDATGGPQLDPKAEEKLETSFQRRWFARFETILHANDSGPVWLKEPPVAEIVREALHHRDGNIYRLDAFSIMP